MGWVRRLGVLLGLALVAGCASDPVAPPRVSVRLDLWRSGGGGAQSDSFYVSAQAVNEGRMPLVHMKGCGAGPGVKFEIRGPDGQEVFVTDPQIHPECPDDPVTFMPGGRVDNSLLFTGVVFPSRGPPFAAPSGTYRVTAQFYGWARDDQSLTLTMRRDLEFEWAARVQEVPR